MHTTPGISDFKEEIWDDWENIMDMAVYLSETIGKHIDKPEILSGLIEFPPTGDLDIGLGMSFDSSDSTENKNEYLQEEREELRDSFEGKDDAEKQKVKGTLMSVWEKIISRFDTLIWLRNIGRRIYERLIQKMLPFQFAEEDTPIWSVKEKEKSIENKMADHFKEKIKESMRERMRKRMRQKLG